MLYGWCKMRTFEIKKARQIFKCALYARIKMEPQEQSIRTEIFVLMNVRRKHLIL